MELERTDQPIIENCKETPYHGDHEDVTHVFIWNIGKAEEALQLRH